MDGHKNLFKMKKFLLSILVVLIGVLLPSELSAQTAESYLKQAKAISKQSQEQFNLYKKAAELGNAEAQYQVGEYLFYGLGGVIKDKYQALEWYKSAAEKDHAEAQTMIGIYYRGGYAGLTQSREEAFKWYNKAVENGSASAMNELGLLYQRGIEGFLEKDYDMAHRYFLNAAYNGEESLAYFYLYCLYRYDVKDNNEAIYWLKRDADYEYKNQDWEGYEQDLKWLRELGVEYSSGPKSTNTQSTPKSSNTNSGSNDNHNHQHQQQAYTPEYGYRDVWVRCITCGGSGNCQVCYGRGGYYSGNYFITCGGCNGTKVCPVCGGRGGYNEKQQYQIR